MEKERNKKKNQKTKNVFNPKIISSTWEKEGIEVSNINNKFNDKKLYI